MFIRHKVDLTQAEAVALARMAYADLREPRDQLRFLLREEARKRGLLPTDDQLSQEEEDAELSRPAA